MFPDQAQRAAGIAERLHRINEGDPVMIFWLIVIIIFSLVVSVMKYDRTRRS